MFFNLLNGIRTDFLRSQQKKKVPPKLILREAQLDILAVILAPKLTKMREKHSFGPHGQTDVRVETVAPPFGAGRGNTLV